MSFFIINLNGNNKDLSIFEFENLFELFLKKKILLKELGRNYFLFEIEQIIEYKIDKFLDRLTFTNFIYKIFFNGKNIEDFTKKIKKYLFQEESFSFRFKNLEKKKINIQKEFISILSKQIKNPKVNLENPKIEFILFNIKNKFYFSKKIFKNQKKFLDRMPKKRPVSKPYTLKSDLARCSINFLNIKKGNILDPFVGIGGILLEANDLNFKCIGADISWKDLNLVKLNFNFFFKNLTNLRLVLTDSSKLFLKENTIDGIVTDIPYGKNSRKLGNSLYENFLENAKIYLKKNKRLIVIYANFTEFEDIALKKFKKIKLIEEYINKSMTRKILILENNKV